MSCRIDIVVDDKLTPITVTDGDTIIVQNKKVWIATPATGRERLADDNRVVPSTRDTLRGFTFV